MIDIEKKAVEKSQNEFGIDLVAMYRQLNEDFEKIIIKAERENWTIEKTIQAMEEMV